MNNFVEEAGGSDSPIVSTPEAGEKIWLNYPKKPINSLNLKDFDCLNDFYSKNF